MSNVRSTCRYLIALVIIGLATTIVRAEIANPPQQLSIEQLEAKLLEQYAAIDKQFANGPGRLLFPTNPRERLRVWQVELARSFALAGATVEEIIKLHPPNEAMWRERSDTLWLYAQPVSPPESREVFGTSEVQKRARLLELPLATYPVEARAANAKGNVCLRLVFAADGTVKHVFPMKSEPYGFTEAAMEAALRIKFEPAIRNGKPASQFGTLVYEFKKGKSLSPYVPEKAFYF